MSQNTGLAAVVAAATGTARPEPTSLTPEAAAQAATDRALAITEVCAVGGEPGLALALIREGATIEQANARITAAKEIRDAVTIAAKSCSMIDPKLADGYIAAGASIDKVRSDLFAKITAAQSAAPTRSQVSFKPEAASADVLKKVVAKVNGRLSGTRNGYGDVA